MQVRNICMATNERRDTAVASKTGADLSVEKQKKKPAAAAAAVCAASIKYSYTQKLLLQLVLL